MSEVSVRIGVVRDLYKFPHEAQCRVRHGLESKTTRVAKRDKNGHWAFDELIHLKLDPNDKNVIIEVTSSKMLKKYVCGMVSVDITNPKLPKAATKYTLGKAKDIPPTSRGEIELTFDVGGGTPRSPRGKSPNMKDLNTQMGIEFAPPLSPRPKEFDLPQRLSIIPTDSAWAAYGDAEVGVMKLSSVACDVGSVKVVFLSTENSSDSLSVWLPRKLTWTAAYSQGPFCRCELTFQKSKPRPCFKVKISLSEGDGDELRAQIEGRAISDESKSVQPLKACFKVSKASIKSAIDKDNLFENLDHDERELLDAAFKGQIDRVKACLDRWDDINFKNEAEETALHKAVINGNPELIKLLVERGADPRSADKFGQSPVDIAEKYFKKELVPLLRTYQ